jgi:N-acetyl-gamma-glutamyl-phosphate reductase
MNSVAKVSPKVAVVGAAGYAGAELVRLLAAHPGVQLACLVSDSQEGKSLGELRPDIKAYATLRFEKLDLDRLARSCQLVFLAQENGKAMQQAPSLLSQGVKVIDLAADFRLRQAASFEQWYKFSHSAPELLAEAVYGLPELYREQIRKARLVANPGCYPTTSSLGLLPLLESNAIDPATIIIDAKSGVSGAGRGKASIEYLYSEVNENLRAYGVGGVHRHVPEIEQTLSAVAGVSAGAELRISFTPHLVPMTRGILATCYASLRAPLTQVQLNEIFAKRYASEPFICLHQDVSTVCTKICYGSAFCHMGVALDTRCQRVIVVSCTDNLGKGAATQAVQNMNLMLGFDETTGLQGGALWP